MPKVIANCWNQRRVKVLIVCLDRMAMATQDVRIFDRAGSALRFIEFVYKLAIASNKSLTLFLDILAMIYLLHGGRQ
jgi:hypothetical protein